MYYLNLCTTPTVLKGEINLVLIETPTEQLTCKEHHRVLCHTVQNLLLHPKISQYNVRRV